MSPRAPEGSILVYAAFGILAATVTAGLFALVANIAERKAEARHRYVRVVDVTEDTTDASVWGEKPAETIRRVSEDRNSDAHAVWRTRRERGVA